MGWRAVLGRSLRAWHEHRCNRHAAALAFYALFALAPILILTVLMAGRILGEDTARQRIAELSREIVAPEAASALEPAIDTHPQQIPSGVGTRLLMLFSAIFGASAFFAQLHDTLNVIWRVDRRNRLPWRAFLRVRLLAFLMILFSGALLLVTALASAALASVRSWLSAWVAIPPALLAAANVVLLFIVVVLTLAVVFRMLPDTQVRWRQVRAGALVTGALFVAGNTLLSLFVRRFWVADFYGAAGSLVILLIWVYLSSSIVLLGAEFTFLFGRTRGVGGSAPARG